jgi:hypothetical protein
VRILIVPALNTMFAIADARTLAARIHPPAIIFVMLGVAALASALLAGYGMATGRGRNWTYMIGFAATLSIALFVILDLEYPRLGLVRIDDFDRALVELRATMR